MAYGPGARALQTHFDTVRLADRIDERLVRDALSDGQQAFVAARDCFFLATVGADGWPSCSYKGGAPGFVRVLDPRTLAFPSFDGNGMFRSLGNVLEQPKVGMLFIDFEHPERLRVEGTASIDPADPLLDEVIGAQCVVRVRVDRAFPNCPRYIHRRTLDEPSPYVPEAGTTPKIPGWKRAPWASDVLPAHDPARKGDK
jgi:predicted pyridoxine 5'-phosphate oxidase superfamily flavin-nucleotide-binding protein